MYEQSTQMQTQAPSVRARNRCWSSRVLQRSPQEPDKANSPRRRRTPNTSSTDYHSEEARRSPHSGERPHRVQEPCLGQCPGMTPDARDLCRRARRNVKRDGSGRLHPARDRPADRGRCRVGRGRRFPQAAVVRRRDLRARQSELQHARHCSLGSGPSGKADGHYSGTAHSLHAARRPLPQLLAGFRGTRSPPGRGFSSRDADRAIRGWDTSNGSARSAHPIRVGLASAD